jgi:putative transposase
MKHRRFSDEQVIGVLNEHEAGAKVDDICRRYAISGATFHTWREGYGDMAASDAKRLRELGAENAKLKRIVADQVQNIVADHGRLCPGQIVDVSISGLRVAPMPPGCGMAMPPNWPRNEGRYLRRARVK